MQNLAATQNHGRTWSKYTGNPVSDLHMTNFRDPSVTWNEETKNWPMAVVLPHCHKVVFPRFRSEALDGTESLRSGEQCEWWSVKVSQPSSYCVLAAQDRQHPISQRHFVRSATALIAAGASGDATNDAQASQPLAPITKDCSRFEVEPKRQ
ncbi:MAG: hypothetical protein ACRYFU_25745 [Janthinobacterium lividum]